MKYNFFNCYKWAIILVVFFVCVHAQIKGEIIKSEIYGSIEEITKKVEVSISKSQMKVKVNLLEKDYENLAIHYEDKDFADNDEPVLDLESAYPIEVYEEEFNLVVDKKVSQRYNRSLAYQKKGNIDKFYEINQDIIMRYPLNIYAARAAYTLGQFEELIYSLEEAKKYYRFVVSSHLNTKVGRLAYIQYALVLAKESYYTRSEQLLLTALNNSEFKAVSSFIALILRDNLASRAIWFWKKEQLEVTQYYLNLFDTINKYVFQNKLNRLRLEIEYKKLKN